MAEHGEGPGPSVDALQSELSTCRRLVELATSLNSTPSLDDLLPAIMEAARELLDSEASSLLVLDDDTGELVFHVATGQAAPELARRRIPADQGIAGWTLQHREPVVIDDPASDPRFSEHVGEAVGFTTQSLLAVPIEVKGDCIGVMEVLNKLDGGFADRDLRTAMALAALAGVALDNASMYARLQQAVVDARAVPPPLLPQYQP